MRPVVLEIIAAPEADGLDCRCLCAVQHERGVCQGDCTSTARRVFFNSMHAPEGVIMCESCAGALAKNEPAQ